MADVVASEEAQDFKVCRATLDDYSGVMRLLNATFFGGDPAGFQNFLPNLYLSPETALRQAYLAKQGERIIGHVGIYPIRVRMGDVELLAGGIGAVATDAGFRGKSIMSKLLNASIEGMKEEGYDISVLWGDRARYGYFGWEVCGSVMEWRLDHRAVQKSNVTPCDISLYAERLHGDDVLRLWNEQRYGTVQTRESLRGVLQRGNWRTVVADGSLPAFAVYLKRDTSIIVDKLAGSEALLPKLLMKLRELVPADRGRVMVRCSPHDEVLMRLADAYGADFMQRPTGQVKVINLEAVLRKTGAKLSEGWADLNPRQQVRAIFTSPFDAAGGLAIKNRPLLPLIIEEPAYV